MTSPDAIHAADERLRTILNVHIVGATGSGPGEPPRQRGHGRRVTSAAALIPPYDPETLCLLVEHSNSLHQNVDAYATNIDGTGYRFDAVIDFDAEEARSKVTDAIMLERLAAREAGALPEGVSTTSAEEVAGELRRQPLRLVASFRSVGACPQGSSRRPSRGSTVVPAASGE